MTANETNEAETLALAALGWVLSNDARAERLLALTGLTPADVKARVQERDFLAAVLRFLENHEPDLMACALVLDVTPFRLVAARQELEA